MIRPDAIKQVLALAAQVALSLQLGPEEGAALVRETRDALAGLGVRPDEIDGVLDGITLEALWKNQKEDG